MFSSTSPSFLSSRFDMFDPAADPNHINEFPVEPTPSVQPAPANAYYIDEPAFDDTFLHPQAPAPVPGPFHYGMSAGQSYPSQNHGQISQNNQNSLTNNLNNHTLQNNSTSVDSSGSSMYSISTEPTPVQNRPGDYDLFDSNNPSNPAINPISSIASSNLTPNTISRYNPEVSSNAVFFDNSAFGYSSGSAISHPNYYSSPQVPQPANPGSSYDLAQPQLQNYSPVNYNYTSAARNPDYSAYYQTQTDLSKSASPHKPYIKKELDSFDKHDDSKRRYRVIRGISAGGCTTRPPKQTADANSRFLPVELALLGANIEDICYPRWNPSEKDDRRRIIRIERVQDGPHLSAHFSIVGAANENPVTVPPPKNVDVVEVSCLECSIKVNDDTYDSQSSDDEKPGATSSARSPNRPYIKSELDGEAYQYYITSVEVVEIVELLIGTQLIDPAERRRERGRVRSNLVPFWSKKPISSRMNETSSASSSASSSSQYLHNQNGPTNQDFRVELARRIMGYEIRKPRGFDKEVRILRWDKLVPALKRALQSYYTEIPNGEPY